MAQDVAGCSLAGDAWELDVRRFWRRAQVWPQHDLAKDINSQVSAAGRLAKSCKNVGAPRTRIGLWGPLYYIHHKETPKIGACHVRHDPMY